MPHSTVRIELVNINSVEDFFAQIEGQLETETPLAPTLDALYDILSDGVTQPLEIIWHDSGLARVALGDWYSRLADVLSTVSSERNDVQISFA